MYLTYTCMLAILLYEVLGFSVDQNTTFTKRALQKEHELPSIEKWANKFLQNSIDINFQLKTLVKLLQTVISQLQDCALIVLYDTTATDIDHEFLQKLFQDIDVSYVHGKIDRNLSIITKLQNSASDKCVSYLLFLKDVWTIKDIIGKQRFNKVIIVPQSSQWRIHEFLSSEIARDFVNLLVICKSEQSRFEETERPYILYTHTLYIDGLGSSKPQIIMSWYKNRLTKKKSLIFPTKMMQGFAGHRFIISVADQPPYVIKSGQESDFVKWDGLEIRLITFLSEILNFTTEFQEAKHVNKLGSGDAVAKVLSSNKADMGLAGLYLTKDRIDNFEMSHGHSHDCAAFISQTSIALPKFRAIMGPFHWTVWLALTITYLLAIFPIAFSDQLTLSHLIKKPGEMENMFWYVFGTFTNCFTFHGKNSWSKTTKTSTRLFIGYYWVFTIIITACYTGSIIAFVTLPIVPTTTDTVQQLLSGHFRTGTLDKGGWQHWFQNVTDKTSIKLLKNIEYIPDIESGLRNISNAFFWPYAFLGSRDELDYITRKNVTTTNKKLILHISNECFAPFSVSIGFPKDSVYKNSFETTILRIVQSGLSIKMKNDVDWDVMRSASGQLLQANSMGNIKATAADDRALSVQDTQGMFLMLGFGFVLGGAALISEWLGGCFKFCKTGRRSRNNSTSTVTKSMHVPSLYDKSNEVTHYSRSESTTSYRSTDVILHHNPTDTIVENVQANSTNHENLNNFHNSSVSSENSFDSSVEINKIFNFDHYFGDDNSSITDHNRSSGSLDDPNKESYKE